MPSLILNGNKIGGTVDDATLIGYNNEESTLKSKKIQDAITELDSKVNENLTEAKEYSDNIKNDLLNGAGGAYDTLKELGELIDVNHDAIDVLETIANNNMEQLKKCFKPKGNCTGNIDEIKSGLEIGGLWWCCTNNPEHKAYCTGTFPTDTSGDAWAYFYLLILPLFENDIVQIAIPYIANQSGQTSNVPMFVRARCGNNKGEGSVAGAYTSWSKIPSMSDLAGAISTIVTDNLNANIVPISNSNGKIVSSNITTTELSYLDGVSSNIQTQLNGKLSTSGTAAAATKLATARNIQTNLGSTSAASFNGTAAITPGITGTLGIGNGGTGATTTAGIHQNITGNHWTTPAYIDCMGSNGHTGGGGYCTIAELKTTMALNNVNNTADSAKSVKYATSAGSANAVAWGNVSGKPSTFTPASHTHSYLPLGGGTVTDTLVLSKSKDVSPTAYNSPALVVGGTSSQVHLEFDNNEIIAKTNASTVGTLYVNKDGPVLIGNSGCVNTIRGNTTFSQVLWCDGELYIAGSNLLNGEGNLDIQAEGSYIYLRPANDAFRYRFGSSSFVPSGDGTATLGSGNNKWKQLYASTTTISTSDRNKKDNIAPLSDIHKKLFMKLLPVSFTFKDGESGRTHIGFISQDVEIAMEELGMTSLDFAGFCKDVKIKTIIEKIPCKDREGNIRKDEEGNILYYDNEVEIPDLDENGNEQYLYSLRYEEFIAINTYVLQDTIKELETVKNKLNDIETRLSNLEK